MVETADHNMPTHDSDEGIQHPVSRTQVETLDANIREFGAKLYFPFRDRREGNARVIGPEYSGTLGGVMSGAAWEGPGAGLSLTVAAGAALAGGMLIVF